MRDADGRAVARIVRFSLGGLYVNHTNLYGRTWQVQVQSEGEDRKGIDDIHRIHVPNDKGEMIPLRSMVEARVEVGPPVLIRCDIPRHRQ